MPHSRFHRLGSRCTSALVLCLSAVAAHANSLTVSAASSLTQAFQTLGPVFEAQRPGTRVRFNFAASDALLAQVAQGAPVDVLACADQVSMDRAQQQGLLTAGSRSNFVRNTLVLVVPRGNPLHLTDLADLQRPEVRRFAIGQPNGVPAGRYAQRALEQAQLWTALQPKAVFAQNVRQSLDYVARGEVEAGFVYRTDALVLPDKVTVALVLPTDRPVLYPVAVVAGSPHQALARQFIDFLSSPPAQSILEEQGFMKP